MHYTTIAILFLATGTTVFIFFKPSGITNYPSTGTSIVMFGDSLVEGVGATEGNTLPELLSKKIGKDVVNMGVRGQTSSQGLARINSIIDMDPKVVIVLFGGNDYLHQVPLEVTFKNIDDIVAILQEFGAVVVLVGVQGGIIEDPYKSEFKRIADKRGALYVPSILSGVIGDGTKMSDQVHPNDIGYGILAKKIFPILKKAM